jgi:hypothetical protein
MKNNINRPDTPLAATPEPQPVSSGLQAAPNMGGMPQQRPATKFEQTANNAIEKLKEMVPTAPVAPAAPSEPETPQQ